MKLHRNKFLLYGLPFVSLVVLLPYCLTEVMQVRIDKRDEKNRMLTVEEMLSFQKTRKNVNLGEEEEYKITMEKLDIEHWENKRVPRPWEQKKE